MSKLDTSKGPINPMEIINTAQQVGALFPVAAVGDALRKQVGSSKNIPTKAEAESALKTLAELKDGLEAGIVQFSRAAVDECLGVVIRYLAAERFQAANSPLKNT
jgi:hypothetical protein